LGIYQWVVVSIHPLFQRLLVFLEIILLPYFIIPVSFLLLVMVRPARSLLVFRIFCISCTFYDPQTVEGDDALSFGVDGLAYSLSKLVLCSVLVSVIVSWDLFSHARWRNRHVVKQEVGPPVVASSHWMYSDESPYAVLGLDSSASHEEVGSVWRQYSKRWHPDKRRRDGMQSHSAIEYARQRFERGKAANTLLSDRDLRRQYDEYVREDLWARQAEQTLSRALKAKIMCQDKCEAAPPTRLSFALKYFPAWSVRCFGYFFSTNLRRRAILKAALNQSEEQVRRAMFETKFGGVPLGRARGKPALGGEKDDVFPLFSGSPSHDRVPFSLAEVKVVWKTPRGSGKKAATSESTSSGGGSETSTTQQERASGRDDGSTGASASTVQEERRSIEPVCLELMVLEERLQPHQNVLPAQRVPDKPSRPKLKKAVGCQMLIAWEPRSGGLTVPVNQWVLYHHSSLAVRGAQSEPAQPIYHGKKSSYIWIAPQEPVASWHFFTVVAQNDIGHSFRSEPLRITVKGGESSSASSTPSTSSTSSSSGPALSLSSFEKQRLVVYRSLLEKVRALTSRGAMNELAGALSDLQTMEKPNHPSASFAELEHVCALGQKRMRQLQLSLAENRERQIRAAQQRREEERARKQEQEALTRRVAEAAREAREREEQQRESERTLKPEEEGEFEMVCSRSGRNRSGAAAAAAAAHTVIESVAETTEWASNVAELNAMGFMDDREVTLALEKAGGNIDAAIDLLLNGNVLDSTPAPAANANSRGPRSTAPAPAPAANANSRGPRSTAPAPAPAANIGTGTPSTAAAAPDSDIMLCTICYAAPKAAFLLPCAHCKMCQACALAIFKSSGLCPECRTPIEQVIRAYI